MNKRSKIRVSAVILVISVISIISITSAKYVYNSVWDYYLKSKEFYFESDLLDENNKKNSLLKWDGSDIAITLKNNENNELVSEYDISYKLTCTVEGNEANYIDCIFIETQASTFEGVLSASSKCVNTVDDKDVSGFSKADCELAGYTWNKEISLKEIKYNLILKDETKNIDEVTVKIIAESKNPYKKTLTGTFYLNMVEEIESDYISELQNFVDYDELTVVNKTDTDKCYVIEFNSNNYRVDYNMDSIISDELYTDNMSKIKVKVSKNNSEVYKFYKIYDEIYTIEDFQLEEEDC